MRFLVFVLFNIIFLITSAQTESFVLLTPQVAVEMALLNNPSYKNEILRTDISILSTKNNMNLPPVELSYKYGQLYGINQGHYLSINQSFGSPSEIILKSRIANSELILHNSQLNIKSKKLKCEVNAAYYNWIFYINKLKVLEKKKEIYERLENIADQRYMKGDIMLAEKSRLHTQTQHIQMQISSASNEAEIAKNELAVITYISTDFFPASDELPMFMINKSNDTAFYSGSLINEYYNKLLEIHSLNVKSKSFFYIPEFSIGFFYQDIKTYDNLWGLQAGLSLPLWFVSGLKDLKKARLENEIINEEADYQKYISEKTIEKLLLQLELNFNKISFYHESALPHAELLMETVNKQIEKEESDFYEYALYIEEYFNTELEYLESLKEYNKIAIQLDFYAE